MKSLSPPFWCGLVFAGFAALGVVGWKTGHLASDGSTWGFLLMFGGLFVLMMAWEFGRHFQGAGARWQTVSWSGAPRRVYLLRGSGLQVVLSALVFLVLGIGAGVFWQSGAAPLDRWQMVLCGAVAVFTGARYGVCNGLRPRGIALAPEGLLWLKEREALLVPWDCIESIAQIRVPKDVGYGLKLHEPSLGIRLKFGAIESLRELHRAPTPLSSATRATMARNRLENGCDLIYSAEELIAPLANIERVIRYFLALPQRRAHLGAGEISADFLQEIADL